MLRNKEGCIHMAIIFSLSAFRIQIGEDHCWKEATKHCKLRWI